MESASEGGFKVVRTQGPHDPFYQATSASAQTERVTLDPANMTDLDRRLANVPPRADNAKGIGMVRRVAPLEIMKELAEPELTAELQAIHQGHADAIYRAEIEEERRLRAANLYDARRGEKAEEEEEPKSPRDHQNNTTAPTNLAFDWQALVENIDSGHLRDLPQQVVLKPPPSSLVERGRTRGKVTTAVSSSTTTTSVTTGITTRSKSRSSSRAKTRFPSVAASRRTAAVNNGNAAAAARGNSRSRSRSVSITQSNKIAQEMANMRAGGGGGAKKGASGDTRSRAAAGIVPLLERITNLSRIALKTKQRIGSGAPSLPRERGNAMIVDDEGDLGHSHGDNNNDDDDGATLDQALTVHRDAIDRIEQRVTGKDRDACFLCNTHRYFVGNANLYLFFRAVMDQINVRMNYEPEPVLNECADFYKDFRSRAADSGIELPDMDQAKWLDHLIYHVQSPEAIRYQEIKECQAITSVLRVGIMLAAKFPNGFLEHRYDDKRARGYAIFSTLLHRWVTTKPTDFNVRSQAWVNANLDPKRAPMVTLQSRNDPNSTPMLLNATNTPMSMHLYQGMANSGSISTNSDRR
jgi:hypothetical protein